MHQPRLSRIAPNARPGLTLVELLVVIVILVMLVGVVLPLAQPALKGREKREAARQINAICAAVQSKALATGASQGVVLIPSTTNPRICEQLVFATTPPSYAGDDDTWRVGLKGAPQANVAPGISNPSLLSMNDPLLANDDYVAQLHFVTPISLQTGATVDPVVLRRLITLEQPWFEIQFNFRGPIYKGARVNSDFYVALPSATVPPSVTIDTTATPHRGGVPFQIIRGPRRSAAASTDLPLGAYIDLTASGFVGGASLRPDMVTEPNLANISTAPIIIMFNAEGALDRIYDGSTTSRINAPLLLLTANSKEPGMANLRPDAGSIWAKVDRRSGSVTTTENLGSVATDFPTALTQSRASALSGMNMGGR